MRFPRRAAAAAAAALLLAAATLPGSAQSVESTVALGGTATAEVPAGGRAGAVGVLLPAGLTKGSIAVKAAPGSTLLPVVALVAPDGTVQDQAALTAAGAKVKATPTSVSITKLPVPTQTGLYKIRVTGADGTGGAPTSGEFTVTVKGKAAKGFAVPVTDPRANIATTNTKADFAVGVPERALLSVTATPNKVTPFDVTVSILTPSGDAVDATAFTTVNSKTGAVSIKNLPLAFFGRHTVRVGSSAGTGTFALSVKVGASKVLPPAGVPSPDAASGLVDPSAAGTLDGSGTTGASTVRWAQVSGPAVTLSSTATLSPGFTAPATRATLAFQLVGTNGSGTSGPALAIVEVDRAPVADAGASVAMASAAPVTLDGSASRDLDGDAIFYAWSQASGPTAALDDPFDATPSFTPSVPGVYVFDLVVSDDIALGSASRVLVSVGGTAPVADAGRAVFVRPQDSVFLSGLRSRSAAGGAPATWSWTADAGNTAAVTLAGATGPVASFTAPKQPTTLRFHLEVDGSSSTGDDVTVVVTTAVAINGSPVAAAGAAQSVSAAGPISLSGTTSIDEGTITAYEWMQVSGPSVSLTGSDTATPSGTAPGSDALLAFLLMVHDGSKYGPPDATTVAVGTRTVPLADAGANKSANPLGSLTLSSAASQPAPGQTITSRAWTQLSGKDWYDVAARDGGFNPAAASPVITVPDTIASLTRNRPMLFGLVVTDGSGSSLSDYVTVNFTNLPTNTRPVIQSATTTSAFFRPGATVAMTVVATDADGDTLSYAWTQVSGTNVGISNPQGTAASVTAPTASGAMVFRITVNDRTGEFNATTTADVTFQVNRPPAIVIASTPSSGGPGTNVTLSGTGTTDPEGDTLAYAWTEIPPAVGSPVTLSNANTINASFTMPSYSGSVTQRRRTFRLTVTDALGASFTTIANVNFQPNLPPVISTFNAAGDRKIFYSNSGKQASGENAETLSVGPLVDGDGDAVTFAWRVISGPVVSNSWLSATSGASVVVSVPKPTVGQPSTGGVYSIGVTASDGSELSTESKTDVLVTASWSGDIYPMVQTSCNGSGCHGSSPQGGLQMNGGVGSAYSALVNVNNRVLPNNYNSSTFYLRLVGSSAGNRMPQGGPFWTNTQYNMVRDWIEPENNLTTKVGLSNGAENN